MMQELNYIRCGDYYIPDIRLPEENRPIGRWGRMHRDYIKEHKIDFAEHHYETECTVRWNESLSETAIKNASITSVVDSQEKELAAAI